MTTINAIWKNGVFTPEDSVDLDEGVRVAMQITATDGVKVLWKCAPQPPLPGPPIESEARPVPFDLPMLTPGEVVTTCDQDVLLPEPHDIPG